MGYIKHRFLIHIAALLIGLFSFSWMFLALILAAHYFISPAQAAQIKGNVDIEKYKKEGDTEGALSFFRTVMILTFQSSIFSGLWYLAGMGVAKLF